MEILRTELKKNFEQLKAKNPKFSLRAFSNKLGLQPGELSEIMSNKRKITLKNAHHIIDRLFQSPTERNLLKNQILSAPKKISKKISLKEHSHIGDPLHFIILSLMNSTKFKNDISWIALKTGASHVTIRKALKRLVDVGLLQIDQDGKYHRTSHEVFTTDDVTSETLFNNHLADLDLAKKKLVETPLELRDFSNLVFLASPKHMKKAKEILRRAQDEIEALMQDEEAEDVYRIATYLYPLTKMKTENLS